MTLAVDLSFDGRIPEKKGDKKVGKKEKDYMYLNFTMSDGKIQNIEKARKIIVRPVRWDENHDSLRTHCKVY